MNKLVTPPRELIQKWAEESPTQPEDENWAYELFIAHKAAQWGLKNSLSAYTLQAIIEAVDSYIYRMKELGYNQAAIEYYTRILNDLEKQLEDLENCTRIEKLEVKLNG